MRLNIPYGKSTLDLDIEDSLVSRVLKPSHAVVTMSDEQLVEESMLSPIGSDRLDRLAKGKKRVVIICSDHTRPVPSRILVPRLLSAIRQGNPKADVTLLIATGCHRGTTAAELEAKFGESIVRNEKIVIHDCDDEENLVSIGTLPSGSECRINRLAVEADLLISEGFIEPHFFAGFSGGRKSVLPGIASRQTVLANHCSEFISSPFSRTGVLEGNPIHRDMVWAAKQVRLQFILNVVLGEGNRIIAAFAGDYIDAHAEGCSFVKCLSSVETVPADIVVTSNNGYPLDQNVYQSVKGMTAAEAAVKQGGVVIIASKSNDGHGGNAFYEMACKCYDPEGLLREIGARERHQTVPDQWQAQIFARVLSRARVIYVSDCQPEMIRNMNMIPAETMQEAMSLAMAIIGNDRPKVVVIPDGVSVIVKQQKNGMVGKSDG